MITQELIHKISIGVQETMDELIYSTLSDWCEEKTEMKISKSVLERALIEYRQNHPEEFSEPEDTSAVCQPYSYGVFGCEGFLRE